MSERVDPAKERTDILLARLRHIRERFYGFQRFLSAMQGIIQSYNVYETYLGGPGESTLFLKLIDDIGWADKCKGSLVGQILVTLRIIDSKLVEALGLLGVEVKSLDEEIEQKIAKLKDRIWQKRISKE